MRIEYIGASKTSRRQSTSLGRPRWPLQSVQAGRLSLTRHHFYFIILTRCQSRKRQGDIDLWVGQAGLIVISGDLSTHMAGSIVVEGDEVDVGVEARMPRRSGGGWSGRGSNGSGWAVGRGWGGRRAAGAPIVSGLSSRASNRNRIGPIASSSPFIQPGFIDLPAIDAHAVATAQVANQNPVVCHRQAAMPCEKSWAS